MSQATISFLVLGAAVVLFVSNRLPPEIVALGAALAMYAFGVLTPDQVLVGFGDPPVMFIASLFVVSEALDATGVTGWMGQKLIQRVGSRPPLLLPSLLLMVGIVSALITPNGSVAALLPVAVVMAMRVKRPSSSFLMPLAFAASAGSLLALTGSPVNVIVSEAAAESTHHASDFSRSRSSACRSCWGRSRWQPCSGIAWCPSGVGERCPATSAGTHERSRITTPSIRP
jgi:Na+/H+ antiporter NhaD/arsenite permease-like protein